MNEMADGWAELVLIDVGPNLGAINRAALIASDDVCVPLAPDLYSLQGLKNPGPALMGWRSTWADLTTKAPKDRSLPAGSMSPAGYWMDKIPPGLPECSSGRTNCWSGFQGQKSAPVPKSAMALEDSWMLELPSRRGFRDRVWHRASAPVNAGLSERSEPDPGAE
jgi:hypothetical protein